MQNKGKKTINDYSSFTPNPSLSAAPTENYQYGMPPNYVAGQTPPTGTIRSSRAKPVRSVQPTGQIGASAAGPVRPVAQTGQTGAMVLSSASQSPLAPLPTSADYSLEQELADFVPPYTTKSYSEHPSPLPLPKMFGVIGLMPIHNMPHKRCPLLIPRHIISAKYLPATMRPILLG